MHYLNIFAVFLLITISCTTKHTQKQQVAAIAPQLQQSQEEHFNQQTEKADELLAATIAAHGGDLYETASYQFIFREKRYTFTNNAKGYVYTVTAEKNGVEITDILENGDLRRLVDKKIVTLSKKDQDKYAEALNSVLYFATLPYKLKDKAVQKSYAGSTTIAAKSYSMLSVTFAQKDGGKDYDDSFMYWINDETKKIDYLAYNYRVNGGGVRFRSAYNSRNIDGITFQDYVNYKAPIHTSLNELPVLFENGDLKELSKIVTENIINLNKNK